LKPEVFDFEGGHVVPSAVLPEVEKMVKGTTSDS
jgi:hypothetical protein